MLPKPCEILLTNDDGIESPGLWAAAAALAELGEVTVVAPRDQASTTSCSMPGTSDGIIQKRTIFHQGKMWKAYSVGGTPAQCVQHGVLEILKRRPKLLVSGINYGENVGYSISLSGTVGAAMEGAALGIPALAMSLQVSNPEDMYQHLDQVDFSTAGYFTRYFAEQALRRSFPPDVHILKIDVPSDATPQTSWQITHLARHQAFETVLTRSGSWSGPCKMTGRLLPVRPDELDPDADIHALRFGHKVTVTPISLDMTSRTDFQELDNLLRGENE